jgi:hypothetical protein
MDILSPYELKRQATIALNKRKLADLGLERLEPQAAGNPNRRERQPSRSSSGQISAVRKSSRLSTELKLTAATSAQEQRLAVPHAPWQEGVFSQECKADMTCRHRFDPKRMHQHLTLSPDGRCVATTGVAGYGAALCSGGGGPIWSVCAVRFGVGGFGVALVKSSMRPPYKSLGKSDATVACYLASGAVAAGGSERPFGPALSPGDIVGVVLRPARVGYGAGEELVFLINGAEVGVAAAKLKRGSRGAYTVAVQPYMGGVAQLL